MLDRVEADEMEEVEGRRRGGRRGTLVEGALIE